jgi:hypothetical protein
MIDATDELRIIAGEPMISAVDRKRLAEIADEFEAVYKKLIATQADLIESQRHRIALNERLIEARKAPTLFAYGADTGFSVLYGWSGYGAAK